MVQVSSCYVSSYIDRHRKLDPIPIYIGRWQSYKTCASHACLLQTPQVKSGGNTHRAMDIEWTASTSDFHIHYFIFKPKLYTFSFPSPFVQHPLLPSSLYANVVENAIKSLLMMNKWEQAGIAPYDPALLITRLNKNVYIQSRSSKTSSIRSLSDSREVIASAALRCDMMRMNAKVDWRRAAQSMRVERFSSWWRRFSSRAKEHV